MSGGYLVITSSETIPQPTAWNLSQEVNAGWKGKLDFSSRPPMELPDNTVVQLTVVDEQGNSKTSPELYLRGREETEVLGGADSGIYELLDTTSVDLSSGTENFDTFQNTTSTAVVAAIASRFSKTITGVTEFPIWKENVKQSAGWPPLRRIAVVAGQQLIVNSSGAVQFVNNSWNLGATPFKGARYTRKYNPHDIFGKIFVQKNLGQGTALGDQYYDFTNPGFVSSQALSTPLFVSSVIPSSSAGRVVWVTCFNASDEQCYQFRLGGGDDVVSSPNVGAGPAVRFSCVVESGSGGQTEGRIRFIGTPENAPPAGIDTAISKTFGTGRGYPQPFSESLIPSLAWATTNWPNWLIELNRGKHQLLSDSGRLQCNVELGQQMTRFGRTGRIEKVEWSGSTTSQRTDVTAEIY